MKANILIVDDEAAIQSLLTRYLEDAGYSCRSVGSVADAKKILASENFDLLLSDLTMPGEFGLELLKHAKKHYPQMGLIVITGLNSREIAGDILKIGVYGYIIKPVTGNVVIIAVENALHHRLLNLELKACKGDLEQKISHRTEKLNAIMDSLNAGVVMLDSNMKILEMNRQMENFFSDISVGKSMFCYQAFNFLQTDRICEECPMVRTFKTGKSCEAVRRMVTPQGERNFRIMTSPILDKDDNVYAGIALYEDITDRMLLERDLLQAQKLESVGQLAAGIAHEINSPIQYIGDNIRFLKDTFEDLVKVLNGYEFFCKQVDDGTFTKEMRQQLSDIIEDADLAYLKDEIPQTISQSLEGVQRVDKIVRAMKEFSHPGGDEKIMSNINKIIDSTVTVCRNEWKYVAEMSLELAPDLPLIPCFPGEISQVFLNIIVNAAHAISDFTEGGSKGMGKISISTNQLGNGIQIRITDSGGGVPERVRDRIFDPFFTTKARGKGTGQGLAIAHRVVTDKHQGGLHFETRMGQGTTFIIDLPIQ